MRCLFIHLLHYTSLIFPHSHLICWGTCLGRKSISQNPVDRRWDPDLGAMFAPHAWHQHVIWIAWHEDVFFLVGEEMKIWRCQIRAVGWVLKNIPARITYRTSSCVHTRSTVPTGEMRRPHKLRTLRYESASI